MINLDILNIFILENHNSTFIDDSLKDDNDAKFNIFLMIIHFTEGLCIVSLYIKIIQKIYY